LVIGVGSWQLSLPGCRSLKEKRTVVKSLKERIRNKFNVSAAETALHDLSARAELTIAVVASDRAFADSVVDRVDAFIERDGRAVITDLRRRID
jgi:uncharacterized protein YlxP (DUF503 family)